MYRVGDVKLITEDMNSFVMDFVIASRLVRLWNKKLLANGKVTVYNVKEWQGRTYDFLQAEVDCNYGWTIPLEFEDLLEVTEEGLFGLPMYQLVLPVAKELRY